MLDNRTSPRYTKRLRAVLITEEHGKRTSIQGKTQDISLGGVSFISDYNIYSSNPVTICLLIEQGDAKHPPKVFEAQSKIASSVLSPQQGGFRLGLEFTKMSEDSKQMLQKFLAPSAGKARAPAMAPKETAKEPAEEPVKDLPEEPAKEPAEPADEPVKKPE